MHLPFDSSFLLPSLLLHVIHFWKSDASFSLQNSCRSLLLLLYSQCSLLSIFFLFWMPANFLSSDFLWTRIYCSDINLESRTGLLSLYICLFIHKHIEIQCKGSRRRRSQTNGMEEVIEHRMQQLQQPFEVLYWISGIAIQSCDRLSISRFSLLCSCNDCWPVTGKHIYSCVCMQCSVAETQENRKGKGRRDGQKWSPSNSAFPLSLLLKETQRERERQEEPFLSDSSLLPENFSQRTSFPPEIVSNDKRYLSRQQPFLFASVFFVQNTGETACRLEKGMMMITTTCSSSTSPRFIRKNGMSCCSLSSLALNPLRRSGRREKEEEDYDTNTSLSMFASSLLVLLWGTAAATTTTASKPAGCRVQERERRSMQNSLPPAASVYKEEKSSVFVNRCPSEYPREQLLVFCSFAFAFTFGIQRVNEDTHTHSHIGGYQGTCCTR